MKTLPDSPAWLDRRLLTIHHNEFAHRLNIPATRDEWKEQAELTRAQLALAAGLIPEPDFPDLQPHIWDDFDFEGITIAKVAFDSLPGLRCTGNLFLPTHRKTPVPGILCPYGHWPNARLHDDECGSIPRRCLMLARLGFAVFTYDMLGRGDNDQILHRPPLQLLRLAELHGASPFALQTWNSIRALDFLCGLPEVDARRIGCTGASGGASQTWTLAALDDRVKVIAPINMLSAHYQGGCICEEGPLLRLNGLTSFDILAACAPRPAFIASVTQDWTNLNPDYEIRALQHVYKLAGAPRNLLHFHSDAPHNYNQRTREHVYPWFCHHLLGQPLRNTIPETDLHLPPLDRLRHHLPPHTPTPDSTRDALGKAQRFSTKDALGFTMERRDFLDEREDKLNLLSLILNNDTELADVAVRVTCPQQTLGDIHAHGLLISRRDAGDVIPALRLTRAGQSLPDAACLVLTPTGKDALLDDPELRPVLDAALSRRNAVFAIDCLGTGETAPQLDASPRRPDQPDFYAFNPSLLSLRVQDILTTLCLLSETGFRRISVIAIGEAARLAACAIPLADAIHTSILDLAHVNDDPQDWMTPESFQPLIYKLGGLHGVLSLIAPQRLALRRPNDSLAEHLRSLYATLDRRNALAIENSATLAELVARAL